MNYVANQKERFLNNFYIKSKRSVLKAANEGPAAYVIPGDTPRPVEAADTVNLLRLMGVEVHTATKEFAVRIEKYPAGSYIIRMDQPYSRMADMLMDTQYYNVNDPRPYDDTGWTLGALRNVKTVRVTDKSVLDAPMVMLTSDAKVTWPHHRIGFHSRFHHQSQHRQHACDASLQAQRCQDAAPPKTRSKSATNSSTRARSSSRPKATLRTCGSDSNRL